MNKPQKKKPKAGVLDTRGMSAKDKMKRISKNKVLRGRKAT